LSGQPAANLDDRMDEFIGMERQAIIQWMFSRMVAGDPIFDTEASVRKYILKEMRDDVRDRLRKRLGV
jgi:hypothetical protein